METERDSTPLWIKGAPPVLVSGLSRYRSWLFPVLTATVLLVLIIVLGVSNTKASNRLSSAELKISNLTDIVQSLNTSLKLAQEAAKDIERLQTAVESHKDQLISASEALRQLSVVESLSRSVAGLKCSLKLIATNRSLEDGCCPLGWEQSGVNCFYFSSFSLSWNESRVWCERYESHLVILHEDKDWNFVTHRSARDQFWVGLSDWRTGHWEWVNWTPYTMERRRWGPGQPDNWGGHGLGPGSEDCAHLDTIGRLNDRHCSPKMRFICQKHSVQI